MIQERAAVRRPQDMGSSERLTQIWDISLPPAQKLALIYLANGYPGGDWANIQHAKLGAFMGVQAWKVYAALSKLESKGFVELSADRVRIAI